MSATTRAPRPGETGRRRLPLPLRRGVRAARRARATSSSTPSTRAAATGRCAPSSSAAARPAARSCWRSRSRARGRSARRCPRRCRSSSRRRRATRCATRLVGRGTDDPEQVERAAATAERELARAGRVRARGRQRPARGRRRRARGDRARATAATVRAARYDSWRMISPRIDRCSTTSTPTTPPCSWPPSARARSTRYYHNLGEGTFDEFPPPMVETGVQELPDDRPRGSRRGQAEVPLPLGRDRGAGRWPGSCSASAAGSPPTRRSSSSASRRAGPRGPRRADAGEPALRRRGVVRRAHRRAGPDRRVRARPGPRRVPRPGAARPRPAEPPRARPQRRRAPRRARVGEHDRQARGRARRQPADERRARRDVPGARRARDERPRCGSTPATRANVATLRERGVDGLEPGVGRLGLARASAGAGRLPEPPELLAAVEARSRAGRARGALDGLRVLVTAGGTREPIDAVRYVGNRSSGRMGFALADEAARARRRRHGGRGERRAAPRPAASRYVDVATAAELQAACEEAIRRLRRPADGRRRRRLPPGATHRAASSRRTGERGR